MRTSSLLLALSISLLPLSLACGDKDTGDGGGDGGGTDGGADGGGTGDGGGTTTDPDADGDGYPASEDCDDGNEDVNPGAAEVCDGIDNDCDDRVDADDDIVIDAGTWYIDGDGDGFGDELVVACEQPKNGVDVAGDCDDGNGEIHPDADEVCDRVDNDCDTLVDDADDVVIGAPTWYMDRDGDGFGDADASMVACEPPGSAGEYVADDRDCDDRLEEINPDAEEVCDGIDNDCDGALDPATGCGVDCGELTLLSYYDSFSDSTPAPVHAAAEHLGMPYADGGGSDFDTLWAAASYDILVIDVPGSSLPTGVDTAISEQIAAGGIVVLSWWQLYSDTDMQSLLEVDATTYISTPEDLHSLDSGLFDLYETVPDPMVADGDEAGINGSYLVATDSRTSEALAWFDERGTNVSILATLDGQVLLNGFLPWDYKTGDNDGDGMVDATELYVNELLWLTDCSP